MARPLTLLVIFFLSLNLFAGLLSGMGVDQMLGIDSTVGEETAVEDIEQNQTDEVSTGQSTGGGTLFGLRTTLANQLEGLYSFIFPGLNMLERAGVDKAITRGFMVPIFSVMLTIAIISFLRGWGL